MSAQQQTITDQPPARSAMELALQLLQVLIEHPRAGEGHPMVRAELAGLADPELEALAAYLQTRASAFESRVLGLLVRGARNNRAVEARKAAAAALPRSTFERCAAADGRPWEASARQVRSREAVARGRALARERRANRGADS